MYLSIEFDFLYLLIGITLGIVFALFIVHTLYTKKYNIISKTALYLKPGDDLFLNITATIWVMLFIMLAYPLVITILIYRNVRKRIKKAKQRAK